jgi:hypothetical protein
MGSPCGGLCQPLVSKGKEAPWESPEDCIESNQGWKKLCRSSSPSPHSAGEAQGVSDVFKDTQPGSGRAG